MIYVRSILAGLAAAVLAVALLMAATIIIAMREVYKQSPGLGAVAFDVNSGWVSGIGLLLGGVLVFALGFAWEFRRSLRTTAAR